jgi:hypothetical protein
MIGTLVAGLPLFTEGRCVEQTVLWVMVSFPWVQSSFLYRPLYGVYFDRKGLKYLALVGSAAIMGWHSKAQEVSL